MCLFSSASLHYSDSSLWSFQARRWYFCDSNDCFFSLCFQALLIPSDDCWWSPSISCVETLEVLSLKYHCFDNQESQLCDDRCPWGSCLLSRFQLSGQVQHLSRSLMDLDADLASLDLGMNLVASWANAEYLSSRRLLANMTCFDHSFANESLPQTCSMLWSVLGQLIHCV